ncbi:MAG: ADOP family duplicated permease [Acidobacteriaceae bacterium]
MSWLPRIFRRTLYNDLAEELRQHIEEKTEQYIREGMTREDAELAARRAFGNVSLIEERSREVWQWPLIESFWADLKYAIRQLRKSPGFATVAILSLALGIGATTSMFSLIDAVLLHPMPYVGWQRIAYPIFFNDDQPSSPERWFSLTWPQYQQLLHANSIESASAIYGANAEITGHDLPENVDVNYVTENIGSFTGIPALLGRNLQPSDAENVTQPPIVLDYRFWMSHYDGDPAVLGKTLELDHEPYIIVGVMPKDFGWGFPGVYAPLSVLPTRERDVLPIMKLKPGVSIAAANAEINTLVHQFAKQDPRDFPSKFRIHLETARGRVMENGGNIIVLLAAAVLMLLLIGCANCAVLLLARGTTRQSELAVRAALGASRRRIVRQLLVEAVLLAVTGSLLGIAFAYWMAKLIFGLFPDVFMHESVIRINLPVLGFSIALAVLSGIVFGLLPSLRISRPDISQMTQTAGRKVAGRLGHGRSLNTLIATQITLTVILLSASGAAIGGFFRMTHRYLGYDPAHVVAIPIPLHRNSYLTREERAAYFEALRQKITSVPGVKQVAIATDPPPHSGYNLAFDVLGSPSAHRQYLRANFIGPEYFSALHIPLLHGRMWNESENQRGAAVAVINQTLARSYFPNGNAVGRQIRTPTLTLPTGNSGQSVGVPDTNGWLQIIGVVGDSLNDGLDKPVLPALYIPYSRYMWDFTLFLVRTQGPPLAALHSIQGAIASVNHDQQTSPDIRDLQQWIETESEYQQQRLFSILFGLFSGLALVLALVGLYSVISYSVAQRTNEFGIRMALGAQRTHVLWIVLRNIGVTVIGGLATGLILFLTLHKLLTHWMQNQFQNPLILAAVAVLFMLCAAAACVVPALRAASIDPMQALRCE